MKVKLFALIIFIIFGFIFFNKSFLQYQVPFPGDLLIGDYVPYNSYSFMGYAPGGFPHKAQNIDVIEQLYPWKYFSIVSLKNMEFPLWNPHNFSGTPHLAAIQSGTFYPFNLLFFIFPFILAWSIYIIIQPILGGFFTYLFLRKLNLSFNSSIFGGLAFSFSSFLVVWMEYGNIIHAIIWLPFVLWLSLKNLEKFSVFKSIIISFALALSVLAGHFQVTIYLYIFSFIFILFSIWRNYKKDFIRKIFMFIGIFALSILISAVQILPSIELFINSSRSNYTYDRLVTFLIPQFHLISIVFPDFFGNPATRNYWIEGTYIERVSYFGVIPLIFALVAIFSKKSAYVWFFIVACVAVFFITFDTLFTRFIYSIYIPPIIATSVPTRIMYIFVFSGSVLAAFGYDQIEKAKKLKSLIMSVAVISAVIILSWVFVFVAPDILKDPKWIDGLVISKRNLIVPTLVFIAVIFCLSVFILRDKFILKRYSVHIKKYIVILVLLLTIFELYYFFQKITPFSPKEGVYPKTDVIENIKKNQGVFRTWGYGAGGLPVNVQTYEGIYSTNGYDPFYIRRYGELLASTENGKVPSEIRRADAELFEGYGDTNLRENLYRQKIMNLLGVKFVLHKKEQDNSSFDNTFDDKIYDLSWNSGVWQLYENKSVLPRAFLVTDYEVISDSSKIIDRIYSNFDLSEAIILEEEPTEKVLNKSNKYSLNIIEYSGNTVKINFESENDAYLFLSDPFFPGWKAYVDKKEVKIYRADYAFRAVFVPKGKHIVTFKYDPLAFSAGLAVSSVTIGILFLLGGIYLIKKKK